MLPVLLLFSFLHFTLPSKQLVLEDISNPTQSLSFLFHGDWGWPGINQTLVGYAMGNWSVQNDAKFLIALGDNFYRA
jgi:hypothetical protein